MPVLDFGLGDEPDPDEAVSFEVWPDTFYCLDDVAAGAFVDMANKLATMNSELEQITLLDDFLAAVLEPDSAALFAARMAKGHEHPIGLRKAIRVLQGLMRHFTAVPTTGPSPSTAGQPNTGFFSMDGVPAAASTPPASRRTGSRTSSSTSPRASSARKAAKASSASSGTRSGSTAGKARGTRKK